MAIQDVQAQLREGQLETILATIPAGVIIADREGRIVSSNERASEIWGGEPPQCDSIEEYAQFTGWWAESGEALAARDWAPVRALLNGEVVEGEVIDIERFDGTRATIVNSAAPLFDNEGEISGAVAVMQDVTEQRERERTNELLVEALGALSGSLEFSEVLDRLVNVLLRAGSHTRATVMLWDEERDELEVAAVVGEPQTKAGTRLPLREVSASMRSAMQNQLPVVADIRALPAEEQGLAYSYGIQTSLIVPLVRAGRLLGVASVDEMRPEVGFSEREVSIVKGIAGQAAVAIENARLYEAEHHVALTLQQALLAMPERIEGVAFAHAYRSASEDAFVGGDFYDIFEIEHDLIGLLVGDIAGKGLEAAVLTQLVKNTVRAHAAEKGSSPATILELTNNLFYQVSGSDSFVTVFFGVLERSTGRLHYTNGGHTTTVILKVNGQLVELPADSPLLGAFSDRTFVQSETYLAPHDLLVLYTDGITEARSGNRQFGESRLFNSIAQLAIREPTAVVITIVNQVLSFTGGILSDDLAVLVVERLGEPAETPPQRWLEASAHA